MKFKVFVLAFIISGATVIFTSDSVQAQPSSSVNAALPNPPSPSSSKKTPPAPTKKITPIVTTFEQVLESAWRSHPAVLGRKSAQRAARAEQKGARWQFLPTPTLEVARQDSSQSENQGVFRLEQPIWTGGRITSGLDVADSRLNAAGAALHEVKHDLSIKTIAVYTEALRQQARLQHATTGLAEHDKLLSMIKRRVDQDVSSSTDLRLTESRYFQAANDLSTIKQAYNNALTQLSQLNGSPVTQISTQGVSDANVDASTPDTPGTPDTLEEALAEAFEYSPILRRLAFEEDAALADISVKRAAYYPLLALRFENSRSQVQGTVVNDSRVLAVLVGQPGAGLSAVASVDGAIARHESARLARESAQRDLTERITLDWGEWVAARQRLENANQASAMSAEVFESYTRQYAIGRKSWIDVLNAVRESTQAQFALEDVRSQALAASLRLRVQMGVLTPTPEPIEPVPPIPMLWVE